MQGEVEELAVLRARLEVLRAEIMLWEFRWQEQRQLLAEIDQTLAALQSQVQQEPHHAAQQATRDGR